MPSWPSVHNCSCTSSWARQGRGSSPINLNRALLIDHANKSSKSLLGSGAQRHRLLIEHRLDRLARSLDVEAVQLDRVAAIGQDGVGVQQHLQPLGARQTPKPCFGQLAGRSRMTRAACTKSVRK